MDGRRRSFLTTGIDGYERRRRAGRRPAWRSQRASRDGAVFYVGPWQPSDEIDPGLRQGGRGPPHGSSETLFRTIHPHYQWIETEGVNHDKP